MDNFHGGRHMFYCPLYALLTLRSILKRSSGDYHLNLLKMRQSFLYQSFFYLQLSLVAPIIASVVLYSIGSIFR